METIKTDPIPQQISTTQATQVENKITFTNKNNQLKPTFF